MSSTMSGFKLFWVDDIRSYDRPETVQVEMPSNQDKRVSVGEQFSVFDGDEMVNCEVTSIEGDLATGKILWDSHKFDMYPVSIAYGGAWQDVEDPRIGGIEIRSVHAATSVLHETIKVPAATKVFYTGNSGKKTLIGTLSDFNNSPEIVLNKVNGISLGEHNIKEV